MSTFILKILAKAKIEIPEQICLLFYIYKIPVLATDYSRTINGFLSKNETVATKSQPFMNGNE